MITQTELKELLHYDQDTGIFTWLKSKGNIKANILAGYKDNKKYIHIKVNNKTYLAHRLAWLYMYGEIPNTYIDHIDGNPENNKISNLRLASKNENQWNRKVNKNSTSKVKNIWFDKKRNKFAVVIQANNKQKMIGRFNTLEEAIIASNEARLKYHGDYSNNGN